LSQQALHVSALGVHAGDGDALLPGMVGALGDRMQ